MITKWLCVCINEKLRLFFVWIKLMYLSVDHKNICRNSVGLLVWCMIRKPNWRVFFFLAEGVLYCLKYVLSGSTIFLSVLNPGVVDNISTHRFTCYVSAKRVSNDSPKLIFKGKYLGLLNACKKICVNYWNSQECHFNMFWTGANRKWEYSLYEWQ